MLYTAILVAVGLLAGALYAVWTDHEEKKAANRRFEARMKASLGPIAWPAPKGPKGFHNDPRHRRPNDAA